MDSQLPDSEIERILQNDQHIVAIHPAEEWKIPTISYSRFKQEKKASVEDKVKQIVDFLNCPYIEDDFGSDHPARRKWECELEAKYDWFKAYMARNALSNTKLATLRNCFTLLELDYIAPDINEFKAIMGKSDVLCMDYRATCESKPTKEKIDYVKNVKQAVYQVLLFLSSKIQFNRNLYNK